MKQSNNHTAEILQTLLKLVKTLENELSLIIPGDLVGSTVVVSLINQISDQTIDNDQFDYIKPVFQIIKKLIKIQFQTHNGNIKIEKFINTGLEIVKTQINNIQNNKKINENIINSYLKSIPSEYKQKVKKSQKPEEIKETKTQAQLFDISKNPEIYIDFIAESKDHINTIETGLLELEKDAENEDIINKVFRGFHTIKGVSGFLNLTEINSLTHAIENLLDLARMKFYVINSEIIDIIFNCIDMLKNLIQGLEDNINKNIPITISENYKVIYKKIEKLVVDIESKKSALGEDQDTAEEQDNQKNKKKIGEILLDNELIDSEGVEQILYEQKHEHQDRKFGELAIEHHITDAKEVAHAIRNQIQSEGKEQKHSYKKLKTDFVRLSTMKIDNLIDLVSELVIVNTQIKYNTNLTALNDSKLNRLLNNLGKTTTLLNKASMSMRMIPLNTTFNNIERLVRDLSRKSGKKAVLKTKGNELELDKNIVEKIYEPLVHIIRNSMDHGIENEDERKKYNKNPTAEIQLKAFYQGQDIVIQIDDDGRGLNKEKIFNKAKTRGIIDNTAIISSFSEKELYNLIFSSGLSTKDVVTDISGRGVGMDVVKNTINSLHGKVEVSSLSLKGTSIKITLPLTVSIVEGLIANVGEQKFIIPIESVVESFRPKVNQLSTVQNKAEILLLRGVPLPVFRLYELLEIENAQIDPLKAVFLILGEDEDKYCLMIDNILDKQEVVVKNLGEQFEQNKWIAGGGIMGDGNIGLILDTGYLNENKKRRKQEIH